MLRDRSDTEKIALTHALWFALVAGSSADWRGPCVILHSRYRIASEKSSVSLTTRNVMRYAIIPDN